MSRIYFKPLPDESTPATAERVNGLLNGEESIEKIVAGSIEGKNLININDISVGVLISAEGVPSASANWNLANEYIKVKPSSKLTFSCKTSQSYMQFRIYEYDNNKGWVQRQETNNVNSWTVTLSTTTSYVRAGYLNNKNATNIQLEIGERVTDYVPYMKYGYNSEESMGNIVVDDIVCKNLLNKNNGNILNAYMTNGTISSDANNRIIYMNCLPNTTYTISKIASQRFRVGSYNSVPTIGSTLSNAITNDSATAITITTGSSDKYLVIYYCNLNLDTKTAQEILDSIQVEKGSEATSYTPYKSFDNSESEVYSTNEIKIGRWIDGKPLYRKVIQFTSPSDNNFHEIATGSFDNIFIETFFLNIPVDNKIEKYLTLTNSYSLYSVNNSLQLKYLLDTEFYKNRPMTVIIKYTKTTD